MNNLKALKQKSQNKHIDNKENKFKTSSCPNLHSLTKFNRLRKYKSETDIIKSIQRDEKIQRPQNFVAKSERNLNILYHHSTSNSISSPTSTASPSSHYIIGNNISSIMEVSNYSVITDNDAIKIPIIGYEVMEERSRFTIFKLRIENYERNNFWLVLRRFTDFTRLHTKLRSLYPHINLILPKKKWFGNNFSSGFLDTRVAGLQTFINTILSSAEMRRSPVVREFFCLDEPPQFSESIEDCKVIFEAQQEAILNLKMQLKMKEEIISNLTHNLQQSKQQNEYLSSLVKSTIGK